jgi:photosystem II stability/assembly factor-like uncharacterized protein
MKTTTIKTATLAQAIIIIFLCLTGIISNAQNWTQIISGTTKKLNTISFPSSTVGYIGGNDSLLLKTTDGGATWTQLSYTGINFFPNGEHIINLQFLNDSVGFITVGPYSGSYATTNGGLTWTAINLPGNLCFNKGMYFFDENNGFIAGSGCFQGELISYLSGGNWQTGTWNLSNINAPTNLGTNTISDIDFYNSSYGLAVSKSGLVFRTIDGGLNWDSVSITSLNHELTSVMIINDTLAYAGYKANGNGFGLYISTDAGQSWNYDGNSATFAYPDIFGVHLSSSGRMYAGGYSYTTFDGIIFNNNNPLQLWNYDIVDQSISDLASHSDSVVFAVGDSGYIVVNYPQLISGIAPTNVSNIKGLLAPNPASEFIQLPIASAKQQSAISYQIYNINGQRVKSGSISTGIIDVDALESGVYLVQVISDCLIEQHKFIKE